jgi:phage-related protein
VLTLVLLSLRISPIVGKNVRTIYDGTSMFSLPAIRIDMSSGGYIDIVVENASIPTNPGRFTQVDATIQLVS